MKLGLFTVLLAQEPLAAVLDRVAALGIDAVELGAGGYAPKSHCNPAALLEDEDALARLRENVEKRGLTISALNTSGNPLHPRPDLARTFHRDFVETVQLAGRLGVDTVIVFSGCPGGSEGDLTPNWVFSPWPPEYQEMRAWQWRERVVPYWKEQAAFARQQGVTKLAFEMHPGFAVYNPETLLTLREQVGETIGANFDPSHLFWQGVDAVEAIRLLGKAGALFHVHAKDTSVDAARAAQTGVLDGKPLSQVAARTWVFRTVGYGHDEFTWKGIVSALRTVGYDGVLSIEHEDALASVDEGLEKAVGLLRAVLLRAPMPRVWWA